jgi:hypothetical protein
MTLKNTRGHPFRRNIVVDDLESGNTKVLTRFPQPNGSQGHEVDHLNFGLAKFGSAISVLMIQSLKENEASPRVLEDVRSALNKSLCHASDY